MKQDFLNSYNTAKWQRLKNKVLERDNYVCQICGDKDGLKQVHHISYKNCHGRAYNAKMNDLITLCEFCHAHDDGDHTHFFNGRVEIRNSGIGGDPIVLDHSCGKYGRKWNELTGTLIAIKCYDQDWWSIGFRSDGDWFPYLFGVKEKDRMWVSDEHPLDDVQAQRRATIEEAEIFLNGIYDEHEREEVKKNMFVYDDPLFGDDPVIAVDIDKLFNDNQLL